MSYTFMAGLSSATLLSMGHLKGLFVQQEELMKQVVQMQVSQEGDRILLTLNDDQGPVEVMTGDFKKNGL